MSTIRLTVYLVACTLFSLTSFAQNFVAQKPSGESQTYMLSASDYAFNATQITAGISWLGQSGGTITFSAGTIFIRQSAPNENGNASNQAAVVISSPIQLIGQGTSATYLCADNRATTLFFFNGGNASSSSISNMTIQGNIYRKLDGSTETNRTPLGVGPASPQSRGSLVLVGGGPGTLSHFTADHVVFQDPTNVGIYFDTVDSVQVTYCAFNFFSNDNALPYAIETGAHNVGIFGDATSRANVLYCSFSGSSYLNSSASDYGNSQVLPNGIHTYAADGLVYFVAGGNYLISGNYPISNYRLEAVHLASCPATVQNNSFNTSDRGISVAFNLGIECSPSQTPGTDYHFTGNVINGGTMAVGYAHNLYGAYYPWTQPYTVEITANTISLASSVANDVPTSDWRTAAINLSDCQQATIQGNHFNNVGVGIQFGYLCGTASISGNDMRGVYGGCIWATEAVSQYYSTPYTMTVIDVSNNQMAKGYPAPTGNYWHSHFYANTTGSTFTLKGTGNTFYDSDGTVMGYPFVLKNYYGTVAPIHYMDDWK